MALITIDWNPTLRHLRQFALAGAALLATLAAVGYYQRGWAMGPASLAVLGTCLGGMGVFRPHWVRAAYVVVTAIAFPIGWVVSHLMLGAVYYGVLTAVGLAFRLIGRDALQRRLEPGALTYWQPRSPTDDLRRYFRQF
jgi:hypothetical protein